MKIYLADKYAHKTKMRGVRDRLLSAGHEVTSHWIDEGDHEDVEENLPVFARRDIDDLLRADLLVAFSYPRGAQSTGGGRHVEFGVALHAGKPIIVVGPKGEHIFHYMPGVRFVYVMDLIELLEKPQTVNAWHDGEPRILDGETAGRILSGLS